MNWLGWTPENIAKAKRLYIDEGYSAAQAAKMMGAPSRNSIISLAYRKGWTRAVGPSAPRRVAASARQKPAKPSRPALRIAGNGAVFQEAEARPPIVEIRFPEEATGQGLRIIDPGFGGCRWPLSGERAELRFCCTTRPEGQAYCAEHAKKAYNPTSSAKELSRSLRRYAAA